MNAGVKIYQIYFNESQLNKLDYTPYLNNDCSVYFESSVIADLITQDKHKGYEYFGVVSHKLRDKINTTKTKWSSIKNIANTSEQEFSPEHFESILLSRKPDVLSFQRHIPHDPITFANQFHPNFSIYFKHIMNEIGYKWTATRFNNVFYCNYFVAKSELYERFTNEMLIPSMKVMEKMPALMSDSKYPHALPDELKKKFGINHYPYHAFICERMFSFFVHINKLKCLHY